MARFKEEPDNGFPPGGLRLLPSESWSKYKYLFVNDFKPEEWAAIDSFYKYCLEYDAAEDENKSYFAQNVAQIWTKLHDHYYAELEKWHEDNPEAEVIDEDTSERIARFSSLYISNAGKHTYYQPGKPLGDATNALENINKDILLSSVGSKLGALARGHSMRKRLTSLITND